jgi:hypothetical protein
MPVETLMQAHGNDKSVHFYVMRSCRRSAGKRGTEDGLNRHRSPPDPLGEIKVGGFYGRPRRARAFEVAPIRPFHENLVCASIKTGFKQGKTGDFGQWRSPGCQVT